MSPQAGELLVQEIAPRIRNSPTNSVAQVGADDRDELCQDGIAIAATLLASAEARGKSISAGNVAFYATRLVRQGRRSTGQSTTDVMSPRTQIAARCRIESLDQPIAGEADGDDLLWVAKTPSVHKSLICSDLRPSCYPLFFVLWPSSTPREQQFRHGRN